MMMEKNRIGGADGETALRRFDRAARSDAGSGYTVILDGEIPSGVSVARALPIAGARTAPQDTETHNRIGEMLSLYEYERDSFQAKCRNFYRQGQFMADYEDNVPWNGAFDRFFPTYHDMNLRQLRGYFTWRGCLRRGDFRPAPAAFAYVYLYELLNGIGTASPEDALHQMLAFEEGFLDSGIGEARIRSYLRRWMLEFSVLHALPAETARQCVDPAILKKDAALAVLRTPTSHTDEDVFSALCVFSAQNVSDSPVTSGDAPRGIRLFAETWRAAAADGLFTVLFGEQKLFAWRPLSNAVYWAQHKSPDADYALTACRGYRCRDGVWQEARYDALYFDWDRLRALLHESDRQFRSYLKAGHSLRKRPDEAWASPYAAAAIAADRQALRRAARPKITIDLTGLEQIRRDARSTRDSLLTEEERRELAETAPPPERGAPECPAAPALDALQTRIVAALLRGESVAQLIRAQRLMPSIVADTINEALFDEIGDNVLDCDGSTLVLAEDYREDVERILGGNTT